MDEVKGQYQDCSIVARINHLQAELEDVMKLKQRGMYSGRHKVKGEGEKEQCPRCTYEKHEAGQKCPAEERMCNTCRDKLCKKKAARRVKEEREETTSEDSDLKEEKEVNRVVRDRGWPGTSPKAKRKSKVILMAHFSF